MNKLLILFITILIIIVTMIIISIKKKQKNFAYTSDIFEHELKMVSDKNLVDFIRYYLTKVPEEFWYMPASTSGKYHPKYALGRGGLIRHTKAAVKIASSLLPLEMYEKLDKNLVIIALIIHDSVKPGFTSEGKAVSTQSKHPLFAVELLEKTITEYLVNNLSEKESTLLKEQINDICRMVKSHMGQWNTDKQGNKILPKPEKADEKFVHLCDYLASRKFLDVKLDKEE